MKSVCLRHRGQIRDIALDGEARRIASSPRIVTAAAGDRIFVWCDGATHSFERVRASRSASGGGHEGDLFAPMPGRVRKVAAAEGDPIVRGMVLIVLEAMKMEHAIRAPKDGILKRLLVREGDLVDAGVELAEIG